MKKCSIVFVILCTGLMIKSQTIPIELTWGNHNLLYQHTFTKEFEKGSRFGLVHIANLQSWYNLHVAKTDSRNEFMNQAYIRYEIVKSISVLGGLFYTNATGLRGSAALQAVKREKDWMLILVPRIDLMKKASIELFTQFEYRPKLSEQLKLYTRIQVMLNTGPSNFNRGYQRFRLGIELKKLQFGFAQNLDEFGADGSLRTNTGIFVRKEFH